MTTARDLVDAIASGKSSTIQATFDNLIAEKISTGIEAYRQAVIDNTFNPELVSESEESIDELSGATLGSYAAKAHKDIKKKREHAKTLDADPKVSADNEKRKSLVLAREYKKDGSSKHRATIDKLTASIEKQKKKIDPDYPKSVSTHTRYKGIERAINRLHSGNKLSEEFDLSEFTLEEIQGFMESEDFTALDELSKSTLANYYSKAIGDRHSKDLARDSANRKGDEDSAKKLGDKVFNRSSGLEKAKAKFFAKDESEEVSELSKKTLGSYVKNAAISAVVGKEKADANSNEVGRHLDKGDIESAAKFAKKTNDLNRKVGKRIVGISKASDRLAKD